MLGRGHAFELGVAERLVLERSHCCVRCGGLMNAVRCESHDEPASFPRYTLETAQG